MILNQYNSHGVTVSNALFFGVMMGAVALPIALAFIDEVIDPIQWGVIITWLAWVGSIVVLGVLNYLGYGKAPSTFPQPMFIYSAASVAAVCYSVAKISTNHGVQPMTQ